MPVDFSTPAYLISFYHISGTISFFLNTFTIWLVIFKSDKIDNFRYFLLAFQTLCTMTDFHVTFIVAPCPLHPIIAGFSEGFLTNVWLHYLMVVLVILIVFQLECLVFCFLRKHQTIAGIMSRHVLPTKCLAVIIAYSCLFPCTCSLFYFNGVVPREQSLDYAREHYPEYLTSFMSLENFAIYELNIWIKCLAVTSTCTSAFNTFLFGYTTMDMLRMLKAAQSKVSAASYKRHKTAVKSLLAQFATSSICMAPPTFFIIVAVSDVQNAQVIIQILAAILTLHSPANAMVLVATTPPYRSFVFRKNAKMVTVVTSMSGDTSKVGPSRLGRTL